MHCANCGKEIPAQAEFCADCGTRIHAAPPFTSKKRSGWKWALGILGGLAVLGALLLEFEQDTIGPDSRMEPSLVESTSEEPSPTARQATSQQIPDPTLREFARLQKERKASGQPFLTLLDLIDMYGEERKKDLITAAARTEMPKFPIRGRWGLIDDPSDALPWALAEHEPFNADVLSTLRKTFPDSKDPEERMKLAVLLYRYRIPAGLPFVLEYFQNNPERDIALLLALHRVESALGGIREVLRNNRSDRDLIYAMGSWEGAADDLLNEGYLHPEGPRGYYMWAFGMARHRLENKVLSHLKAVYGRREGSTKIIVGLAMRQGGANQDGFEEYLAEQLAGWRHLKQVDVMYLAQVVLRVPVVDAERYLREIVRDFSENPEARWALRFHMSAAWSLARLEGDESAEVLGEILRKMLAISDAYDCNIHILAQVMAKSASPTMDRTLLQIGGEEFAQKAKAINALRRVPVELLPRFSQECVAPSYFIE